MTTLSSVASLRRRARRAGAAAVAVAAVAPAAAMGATPGDLGPGTEAAVALDAAGTAYIAWNGLESGTTSLQFCRVPRNALACDLRSTVPAPAQTTERPFVTVSADGQTVRVLSWRFGPVPGDPAAPFSAVYMFTSTNGLPFGPGVRVGTAPFSDAALGPGSGSVSVATHANTNGGIYQRIPIDGSPAPTTNTVLLPAHPYGGAVGFDGQRPLVVFENLSSEGVFRRWAGPADPNNAAAWEPAVSIGTFDYPHLASGAAGLFLLAQNPAGGLDVRRFNGSTFDPPVGLPNGSGGPSSHITEDPAGRLHAVWRRIAADGTHLEYATSDGGAAWKQGSVVIGPESIGSLRVAAGGDHKGFAVWDTGAGSSQVRFLEIGPEPPVAPTVIPTPAPAAAPVAAAPKPAPSPVYRGAVRPVKRSDRQASYTLTVPRNCVAPGQRFNVTLGWKRKKRKGNLFVKVRRADFYLGAKRLRVDRKPPFVQTYTLQATQPPGSTIRLRARAFVKVKRGRTPKKSIATTVRVCP